MISFDEAVGLIDQNASPLPAEEVSLADAHGRVLAAPVIAAVSSPRSDVSAMDGYAVRECDLRAFPVNLLVSGESYPGNPFPTRIEPGHAVRIFTGAPIPPDADRVVIQENVRRDGDVAIIDELPGRGRHIRPAGSDFREQETLLPAGTVLSPRALVAAAAADAATVMAHRRPRVAALATGDELADPGSARRELGKIPESVSPGVIALVAEWGARPLLRSRLADRLEDMEGPAAEAVASADLVVVTGGASVGERDFARAMFGDRLELIFSKVAIKPGKPVWLGRVGRTWIMGLPGNPTSAMVTARLLLAPLLCGLTGRQCRDALAWGRAPLRAALGPAGGRETFSRGSLEEGAVLLTDNQESGAQRALAAADILIRRPAGHIGFGAGEMVDVLSF